MSRTRTLKRAMPFLLILPAGAALMGGGCPASVLTPVLLSHQSFTGISAGTASTACQPLIPCILPSCSGFFGWAPTGNVTCTSVISNLTGISVQFTPTIVGKTVTITLQGSAAAIRIPASVSRGTTVLTSQTAPTSSTTTLSFVVADTSAHILYAGVGAGLTLTGGISGAAVGDTIVVDIVQQP